MRTAEILPVIVLSMVMALSITANAHFNPPLTSPNHIYMPVEGTVTALVASEDGALVAAGTSEGLLYLVNTTSGEALWITALQGGIARIVANGDLSEIVVGTTANELVVFDRDGTVIAKWERCTRFGIKDLYLTSGGYVVVLDQGGWIYSYNPNNVEGRGEDSPLYYRYVSPPAMLKVNVTGVLNSSLILTSEGPGDTLGVLVTARVYDNTTGNATEYTVPGVMIYVVGDRSLMLHGFFLLDDLRETIPSGLIYYMVGGQTTALVSVYNRTLSFILVSASGNAPSFVSSAWSYVYGGDVTYMKVSPGGDRLFVYAEDGNAYCFDRSYSVVYTYRWSAALGAGGTASLSGDLSLMAAGSSEGWVYLFDIDAGKRLWRAWFSENPVTALALSYGGDLLAAGYRNELHILRDADKDMVLFEVTVYDYNSNRTLTNTSIRLSGVDLTMNASAPAVFLLSPGSYNVYVDNLEVGVYSVNISLGSDTILIIPSDRLEQPTYKLIIRVSDNETQGGISGALIEAHNTLTGENYTATTDASGTASLMLPRGPYIVSIAHSLYYPASLELGWITGDTHIDVKLDPRRAQLLVRVESPVVGPLKGAAVKLYGPEPTTIYTDAEGEASTYLRLGTYSLSVYAPHHEAYTTSIRLYSDTSISVELTPLNYTLRLDVYDAEYLTPIQEYHVILAGTMNIHVDTYMTPGNSTLSLPYGTYQVTVEARGFEEKTYQLFLDSDRTLRLELRPIRATLEVSVSSKLLGPLSGANITLVGPENTTSYTDAQGYAKISLRLGTYSLSVYAPHHEAYHANITIIADSFISVQLEPLNYTLRILVVDKETGQLLPSAPVVVYGPLANPIVKVEGNITPGNSTLSLPYGTYQVTVDPPYYHPYITTVDMAANTTLRIYVTPIRVNLVVLVESKSIGPVRNARVMLLGPENLENTTDANGRTVFRPRMGEYALRVEAAYHYTYVSKVFIGESKTIKAVLEPVKYTLRIVARDAETKNAIPLVTLVLEGPSGISRLNITPTTLLSLPYGNYRLTLEAPGYHSAALSLEPLFYSRTIEVYLKPVRVTLRVTVTDPIHGPVEGAEVYMGGPENITLRTDRFGKTSANLRIGNYTIKVYAPHRENYSVYMPVTEPMKLDVVLGVYNYTLTITAIDARDNHTLKQWRVSIEGPGNIKLEVQMNVTNNNVTLPYGHYTIYIYADHYVYTKKTIVLDADKELAAPLRPEEYLVRINVSSRISGPIGGAIVEAYWKGAPIKKAVTDEEGQAVLKLPYGDYTITVRHMFFHENTTSISVEKPVSLNITLQPCFYNVTVRVTDFETGAPLPTGIAELHSEEFNVTYRANITRGVGYALVTYGNYTLLVKAPDYVGYKGTVEVAGNMTLNITLRPIYYAVMINVVDDRGKPIEGARIEIKAPTPVTGSTDATGTFVANLKKGSYPVIVEASGYHSAREVVSVAGPVTKTIKMRPTPSTLLHRYLLLIVALVVVPATLLIGAIVYRRRRERMLEEEMEELLEEI